MLVATVCLFVVMSILERSSLSLSHILPVAEAAGGDCMGKLGIHLKARESYSAFAYYQLRSSLKFLLLETPKHARFYTVWRPLNHDILQSIFTWLLGSYCSYCAGELVTGMSKRKQNIATE